MGEISFSDWLELAAGITLCELDCRPEGGREELMMQYIEYCNSVGERKEETHGKQV